MGMPTDPVKREEARKRMSEAQKRRFENPDEREGLVIRAKERMKNPDERERLHQLILKNNSDPVKRADMIQKRAEAHRTPESREKMSKVIQSRLANHEYKEMINAKRAEAMRRPEVRQKLSEQAKTRMENPDARQLISEKTKEAMARPEVKERASQGQLQSYQEHPERRQKRGELTKQFFSDEDNRQRHQEATKAAMPDVMNTPEYQRAWTEAMAIVNRTKGRTSIEIAIAQLLDALEIGYEEQKPIGRYHVDFYIASKNLVVECDGDYWHSKPHVQERDIRKNAYLLECGYIVLRLTETQIKQQDFALFIQALV